MIDKEMQRFTHLDILDHDICLYYSSKKIIARKNETKKESLQTLGL